MLKLKLNLKFNEISLNKFLELFQLSVLAVGSVESVSCSKHWDEKKTKDYSMLSKEMGCNPRGRNLS